MTSSKSIPKVQSRAGFARVPIAARLVMVVAIVLSSLGVFNPALQAATANTPIAPLVKALDNTREAQAAGTLTIESAAVSGCYLNGGVSKATVSVQVGWTGLVSGDVITVQLWRGGVLIGTRTINAEALYDPGSGSAVAGPIVTPQVVAFETDANGPVAVGNAVIKVSRAGPSGSASLADQDISNKIPAPCLPLPCTAATQLGGVVFIDVNANGVQDASDTTGVAGVVVTVYDSANAVQATATTNGAGKWTISSALTYPARVEFTNLPTYGFNTTTQQGTNNGSSVQFVNGPSCDVKIGVSQSAFFSQDNPTVSVPIWRNGDPLTTTIVPTASERPGLNPALVGVSYTVNSKVPAFGTGLAGNGGTPDPSPLTVFALASQIGTVWANAWDKQTGRMFEGAVLRRHEGLGPEGLGGIYVIDPALSCNAANIELLGGACVPGAPVAEWDLSTQLGINVGTVQSNAARGLPASANSLTEDTVVFDQVGTVGIGGMDLSEDGNTLYFTNLFDKKLYAVDITAFNASGTPPGPGDVQSWAIGSSGDPAPTCTGGNLRPWATKVFFGEVYSGMVCDAMTSQNKSDLKAFVYKFNPTSGNWTKVFGFTLLRSKTGQRADAVKVNNELVVAKGAGNYSIADASGSVNDTYWLEETELDGNTNVYGPLKAQANVGSVDTVGSVGNAGGVAAVPAVSDAGGVPVVGIGSVGGVGGVEAAGSVNGADGAAVIDTKPAVVAPSETQAQSTQTTQQSPATQASSVQTAQQTQATQAQVAQADPANGTSNDSPSAVVIGANDGVAVARGGSAAQARLPESTAARTPAAKMTQSTDTLPLLIGAGALVAMAAAGAGAVVIRRKRKMRE